MESRKWRYAEIRGDTRIREANDFYEVDALKTYRVSKLFCFSIPRLNGWLLGKYGVGSNREFSLNRGHCVDGHFWVVLGRGRDISSVTAILGRMGG